MLNEKKHFEFTTLGYRDAVIFLKQIGRYSEHHQNLPISTIIAEANRIKNNQQILTE